MVNKSEYLARNRREDLEMRRYLTFYWLMVVWNSLNWNYFLLVIIINIIISEQRKTNDFKNWNSEYC